jgi:hypothetical protein
MKMTFVMSLLTAAITSPLSFPAIANAQPTTQPPHMAAYGLKMDIQTGETVAELVRYTGDKGALKALQKRANQGDLVAQYELATLLQTGYPGQAAEPIQALLAMTKLFPHPLAQAPIIMKSAVLLRCGEIIYARGDDPMLARQAVELAYHATAADTSSFGCSLHKQAAAILKEMDLKL